MRLAHLEAFAPICARCRVEGRGEHRLVLAEAIGGDGDDVVEGALHCPEPRCRHEYPILDGIPILVPDVRELVAKQAAELRARDDLTLFAESLIGDCLGPDGDFGRNRLYLSSYGRAHWGDLDPERPGGGGLLPLIAAAGELAGELTGRWVDVGCSVGRGAFELAARTGDLALGVDVSIAMLRVARRAAILGRVRHPVRRGGVVYDRADFAVDLPARARVDFWCADATSLPFASGAVDGALSLNVLDSVAWPLAHLHELGRALAPRGRAVLATPYDWSASVTPIEGWIGGHSQRTGHHGASAVELRRILARADRPAGAPDLAIDAERDDVAWTMAMHDRAEVTYRVHLMRLVPG